MEELASLMPSSWRLARRKSKRNPYDELEKKPFVGRKGFKKSKPKIQRLGSKGKRSWRLRMPKIRIRMISPLKLLAKLRDAYVNMMMSLAGTRCVATMGPMGSVGSRYPGRKIEHSSYDPTPRIFTEAELMYIEYLKRDPAFMRSLLKG